MSNRVTSVEVWEIIGQAAAPSVLSAAGETRYYYNSTSQQLFSSTNGGAWTPVGITPVSTTANFTVPAIGSTVSVSLDNTAGILAGNTLLIVGGGFYTVSSVTNSTTIVAKNTGVDGNAAAAGVVASGAQVFPADGMCWFKTFLAVGAETWPVPDSL